MFLSDEGEKIVCKFCGYTECSDIHACPICGPNEKRMQSRVPAIPETNCIVTVAIYENVTLPSNRQ